MFQIDLKNRKSIYEQIVCGCKEMILKGEIAPGGKLPSVREMSARLTVNPNTIQKAYSRLEQDGWIYTVAGRGAFVSEDRHGEERQQLEEIYERIELLVEELRLIGEDDGEILRRLSLMAERVNEK